MSYEIQTRATPPPELSSGPICFHCGGTFAREQQVDGDWETLCIQCGREPFSGYMPRIGEPLDEVDVIPTGGGAFRDRQNNQWDKWPRQGSARRTLHRRPYVARGGTMVANGPEVHVDHAAIDWDLKLPRGTPAAGAKMPPPEKAPPGPVPKAKPRTSPGPKIPKEAPVVRAAPLAPAAVRSAWPTDFVYTPPRTVYRCDFCDRLSLTRDAAELHMGRDHAAMFRERLAVWNAELEALTARDHNSLTSEDWARMDKLCKYSERAHELLALAH